MIILVGALVLTAVGLVVFELTSSSVKEKKIERPSLLPDIEKQMHTVSGELKSLREDFTKVRASNAAAQKELKDLRDEKSGLENLLNVLQGEQDWLKTENSYLKEKSEGYDILQKEKEQVSAKLAVLNNHISELNSELHSRDNIINELRVKEKQIKDELVKIKSDYLVVQSELENFKNKEEELNNQIATHKRWIAMQEEEMQRLKDENTELQDDFEYEKHYG